MATEEGGRVCGAGARRLGPPRALARSGDEASGSKGSCRIFRLGYDDPELVRLVMRARGTWTELEDESARRLLHPTPHLTIGEQLDAVRDAMRIAGAPHEL